MSGATSDTAQAPAPDKPSKPFVVTYGEPTGRDYPPYAIMVLHTELRSLVPDWLELPVAFEILAREYRRESDHRDDAFATLCQRFADLLYAMVS